MIALQTFVGLLGVSLSMKAAAAAGDASQTTGQKVHRCVGLHGEIVFSGDACGATESAAGAIGGGSPVAPIPAADSCPASVVELRERVVAAIARHDPNAIAGMLHWRGVGSAVARSRLLQLRDLAKHELLAIDSTDAAAGSDTDEADHSISGLRVRTGSGDTGGVHEQAFGIEAEGGCYWLIW